MSADELLKAEFEYFLNARDELVKLHQGRFVVIKGLRVIGVYDSELEAIEKTSKEHELGTFLVQCCAPDDGTFTQTFHSRVSFG